MTKLRRKERVSWRRQCSKEREKLEMVNEVNVSERGGCTNETQL